MMTETRITQTVERLHTQSPHRIWGLSTESVYTALAATVAGDPLGERLTLHTRAETLRTNDTRELSNVVDVHRWLLRELSLYSDDGITLLGVTLLTADRPRSLIQAAVTSRFGAAETILRSCRDSDDLLPRSEFDSMLAERWDKTVLGPLLASLGFITVYPSGVDPSSEIITRSLKAQRTTAKNGAVAAAYSQILPSVTEVENQACVADLVDRLVDVAEETPSIAQTCATLVQEGSPVLGRSTISEAVEDQLKQYKGKYDTLQNLLSSIGECKLSYTEVHNTIDAEALTEHTDLNSDGRTLLADVVTTVSAHSELARFDLTFLTDHLPLSSYEAYQVLSQIPGVEVATSENDMLVFKAIPEAVGGQDRWEEYTDHIIKRLTSVQRRIETLDDASVTIPPLPTSADRMIAASYGELVDGDVAPTYFTHTLIDPNSLGDQTMNDYVGDSRGLGRERARLRRWHSNRSSGLKSYTVMTDRLFSLGLERKLEEKVLRIMTPFDDDTFNAYVSNIRRLLDDGYELRLLTRHTKRPYEWRRLQKNLLSKIKNHRDQITVRTYSRFKEYQRVTADMDFRKIGELGIHGKLQTIGSSEEGASLLGSANFMVNSFNWNPECGVYTERTPFVAASIEFFDIVWDISAADELAVERLQGIPDRKLVPSYYS